MKNKYFDCPLKKPACDFECDYCKDKKCDYPWIGDKCVPMVKQ